MNDDLRGNYVRLLRCVEVFGWWGGEVGSRGSEWEGSKCAGRDEARQIKKVGKEKAKCEGKDLGTMDVEGEREWTKKM